MSLLIKERSFYQRVLTIGGPVAAQQVITAGVNMMDTIMLGQVGETALAASSMATQVHNLFHFMCMGMGMGASVLIARFWGAGERESLRKTLSLLYRFCLAVAAVYTFIVGIAPERVMRLLTPDTSVIFEGVRYLRWTLPCYFLYGLSLVTTVVLRNSGQMRISLYTSIGAFFINVFFNWVFIFGKLGAPVMGVAGAALGTLISRVFECFVICGFFFSRDKKISFRIRDLLEPCGELLPEFIRISIPVMISDTLLGLGNSMTSAVGGRVGKAFMSANSITGVAQQVTSVFTSGLGQAAVIITGNTLGEGDVERAKKQGTSFAVLGYALGVLCGLLLFAVTPVLVGSYKLTAQTSATAIQMMHAMALLMVFITPASILTKGVLRGGGDTRFLMAADILFLWVVSVPLGYLAGVVWKWSAFWVFLCLKIDHVLKATWCLFRLRSGKWIKKIKSV